MVPQDVILVGLGDSKMVGLGSPEDYDGMALPIMDNYGTGYTSPPVVTLSGATDGTGAIFGSALMKVNGVVDGRVVVFPVVRGHGYNDPAKAPIITITRAPGDTTGAGATAHAILGGGYVNAVEAGLRAQGIHATYLNLAKSGLFLDQLQPNQSADGQQILQAVEWLIDNGKKVAIVVDALINNTSTGETSDAVSTEFDNFFASFLPLNVPIILDKTCGTPSNSADAGAWNTLLQTYFPVIDSKVQAHPNAVYPGANLYPVLQGHDDWYGQPPGNGNIHPNHTGNAAQVAPKVAAYGPILSLLFGADTADPYTSDPSGWFDGPVNYKHSAPTFTSFNGLGTRAVPNAILHWTNPDDFKEGDDLLLERRIKADPTGAITEVAVIEATGNPLALPTTYTDLTVTNGILYQYRLTYRPATS